MGLADDITLTESLRFAVPIFLADLLARPEPSRTRTARWWAADGARAVGERGDLLQFVRPGRTTTDLRMANTFQQLARGLAALVVLHPPGVDVAGLHWCLQPDCRRCRTPRQPGPTVAEINAQLEALDADYRRVAGLPPYTPSVPCPVAPLPTVPAPRRPVTTLHLPEVA
ncbi:hypothetical protein ACH4T9_12435 [Micromonospora sp. NPDC020750]|uniref:hypothetical protein n=1 Tax=unclassified Micromonospora TaxID=2617518 RepID=UPI0037886A65